MSHILVNRHQLSRCLRFDRAYVLVNERPSHAYMEILEIEILPFQPEDIAFQDLAKDEWILFARRSHPVVRAAIMDAAQRQGVAPKHAHDILTAQEAIHLVSQHVGVAIVTKPVSAGLSAEGVVIRPLSDPSLSFETCLIMRADDDSRLVNDFGRSFLRRYAPQRMTPKQMELSLSV